MTDFSHDIPQGFDPRDRTARSHDSALYGCFYGFLGLVVLATVLWLIWRIHG